MAAVNKSAGAVVDSGAVPAGKTHSVPLKVDATQLNSALQKVAAARAAGPQVKSVSPAEPIKEIADAMWELQKRYDAISKLAVELNDLNPTQKLPAHLDVKKITIDFAITKDGKTEEHTAEVLNPTFVADLASLLTTEYGFIFSSLQEYSERLAGYATQSNESFSAALKRWEETSRRQRTPAQGASVAVATSENTLKESSAPVTLEDK